MKKLVIAISALAMFGLVSTANAQSLFERCQKDKEDMARMDREATDLTNRITDIDKQMAELRRERVEKDRQRMRLQRRLKRERVQHARRCRGLRECENLDRQVAQLKQRMEPQAERLRKIRDGIRDRSREISELSTDVHRMENQYRQLGCDNLQIGQTAQSTFDKCSQLSKDWASVQGRIDRLQDSVARLRAGYQKVMQQMRANNVALARLLKKFRDKCSHSRDRLAELEQMEKNRHEYQSIGNELEEMSTKVRKFRAMKLAPAGTKTKPTLKPKTDDQDSTSRGKHRRRKHTLKPAK